ncbi:MAG: SPOR domain-containing protein [Bacteroidia bacterium]|nr:SPOR domain-containing protein [Bacteroidia bacterium]NND11676.1 SPOR domain-containing protein [Flavobacteriaceae bacterium]NNK28984.1 SPOR domain-containing protein [Flavobacteriaceae bacterium]RZV62789.1 MAG: SPOR domain-containing protein [Flavobacteriaceae bacterium]
MKTITLRTLITTIALILLTQIESYAQQGSVTVNQSPEIDKLLDLKKDISIKEERYKISIYSGSLSAAEAAQANFRESFPQYSTIMEYETPNYKIYIGNFRSRLEADRALQKVKPVFSRAFILKPEK